MAIPHASIARLSSLMMLLDPDPAGEITASLSRDTRGIGNVVRRRNLHCSVAAIPVSSGQCGRGMHSAEVLGAARAASQKTSRPDRCTLWRRGRTEVGSPEGKNRGRQRASKGVAKAPLRNPKSAAKPIHRRVYSDTCVGGGDIAVVGVKKLAGPAAGPAEAGPR